MAFQIKFLVIFIVGAITLIIGGVIYAVFPGIVKDQVEEQVVLKKGGMIYDNWVVPGVPLKMKFYFFNTTNSDEVQRNGAKPNLIEVGPYIYTEYRLKENITYLEKDQTKVSFKQNKRYIFERDQSYGDETDLVTIPNLPVIAIVAIAGTRPASLQNMLNIALKKDIPLYRTQTVKELTFDGYYDPFVNLVQNTNNEQILPNATFGLLYGTNDTNDGEYVVYTGVDDPEKFSQFISWQGMTELPYWENGTTCAMINGTDGLQYAPFITKDKVLRMFITEIYRSVFTVYEKEVQHQGIDAYRFTPTFDMFGDQSLTPENKCFAPYEDYLPSGLHDISSGRDGAPIFFSNPHFYMGDPTLLLSVTGLNPSKDEHKIVVDIEPTTGTVVNGARKAQINIRMKPAPFLKKNLNFANMPDLIHPVAWIDEGAQIDEKNAEKFIGMLYTPKKIATGVMYTLMAVGSLLVVVGIGLIIFKKKPGYEATMSQQELTKTSL